MRICQLDFSFDWGIKELGLTPRTKPLNLYTREQVIAEGGKIGGDAIEFRHEYWSDCDPKVMARRARDAGLEPASYVFVKNIALPDPERRPVIDEIYGLLDRTAELGAKVAMNISGLVDDRFTIEQQLMWMIEGIRTCAERAGSMGITLLMENLDWPPGRPFAGTGTVCRRVCEAVDSPAFRLIYDFKALALQRSLGKRITFRLTNEQESPVILRKRLRWVNDIQTDGGQSLDVGLQLLSGETFRIAGTLT